MKQSSGSVALVSIPVAIVCGAGMAVAGSSYGTVIGGIPLFAALVALAFLIQWVAFIPAFLLGSERFFDLTGSITYLTLSLAALLLGPPPDARSILLFVLIAVWAIRLGSFLFRRVKRSGHDARFDAIKGSFPSFLNVWTLQGLWVTLTLSAALAAITASTRRGIGASGLIGLALWLLGFALEAVADAQKRRFRADEANHDAFIRSGLWAWSRHPNYFGEIVLWSGIAAIALPVLRGAQFVTLLSPVFVALLLIRVSGIPLLEKRSDEKWGGTAEYEAYKAATPVLVLRPPRKRAGM